MYQINASMSRPNWLEIFILGCSLTDCSQNEKPFEFNLLTYAHRLQSCGYVTLLLYLNIEPSPRHISSRIMKVVKMGRKDISLYVLKEVVADLGQVFTTKDVSEDIRMKQAHPNLTDHSHYHAFVGGALSDYRAQLEIDEVGKSASRGSRWQKI